MGGKTVSFKLPKSLCRDGGDGLMVVKELSANDELEAAKEALLYGDTQVAMMHAIAKRQLVSFDGAKVSWEDGKIEELWDSLGRRGRQFVNAALNKAFFNEDAAELLDFLASRKET